MRDSDDKDTPLSRPAFYQYFRDLHELIETLLSEVGSVMHQTANPWIKRQGVIPANTQLPPRPEDLAAWDSLPEDHKKLFRRQAEVFGGFVAHTDHHVGRLLQAIEDIGELDNTLSSTLLAATARAPRVAWSACITK